MWEMENYHRGLKQCCGVERIRVRARRAQRNHIGPAIRTFLLLEHHRLLTGIGWFGSKIGVVQETVCTYVLKPTA